MARKHTKNRGQKKAAEHEHHVSDLAEDEINETRQNTMRKAHIGDKKEAVLSKSKASSVASKENKDDEIVLPPASASAVDAEGAGEQSRSDLKQRSLNDILAESPNVVSPSAPSADAYKKREENSRFSPEELLNNFSSPVPPPLREDLEEIEKAAKSDEIEVPITAHEQIVDSKVEDSEAELPKVEERVSQTTEVKAVATEEPNAEETVIEAQKVEGHEEGQSTSEKHVSEEKTEIVESPVEIKTAETPSNTRPDLVSELIPSTIQTPQPEAMGASVESIADTPSHIAPEEYHPQPTVSDTPKDTMTDNVSKEVGDIPKERDVDAPVPVQSKIEEKKSFRPKSDTDGKDPKKSVQRSAEWSAAHKLFQTVGSGFASPSDIQVERGETGEWSAAHRLFDNGLWNNASEGNDAAQRDDGVHAETVDSKYNVSSIEWSAAHKLYNQCPKAWLSASRSMESKLSPPGSPVARDDPPAPASHSIRLSNMRNVSSYALYSGQEAERKLIDNTHTFEPQEPAEHLEYNGSLNAMHPSLKEETAAIAWAHQFLDQELEWRNNLLRTSHILTKGGPKATSYMAGYTKPSHLIDVAKSRFPSAVLQVHASTDEATLKFERDILLDRAESMPMGPYDLRAARPQKISFWKAPKSKKQITTPQNFEQLRVANALNMHYYRMWTRFNTGILAEAKRR